MAVTLKLPTVLAKSAGGQTVHEARGVDRGRRGERRRQPLPRAAPRLRDAKGQPYSYVIFYVGDEDIRFQKGFCDVRRGRGRDPRRPGDRRRLIAPTGCPSWSCRRSRRRRSSATAGSIVPEVGVEGSGASRTRAS